MKKKRKKQLQGLEFQNGHNMFLISRRGADVVTLYLGKYLEEAMGYSLTEKNWILSEEKRGTRTVRDGCLALV